MLLSWMPVPGTITPEPEPVEHFGKEFSVLRQLDAFRLRPDDRHSRGLEPGGEVERGLAAELDDHALGAFLLDDGEPLHVAERDLRQVYELLWHLAPMPGAVSTAAAVHHAMQLSEFARTRIELTTAQSAAIREAVALLHTEPS